MLQRARELLALLLVILLPFHAFAVTVLTRLVVGPGHAPLGVLAFWKEALLAVIIVLAVLEMLNRQMLETKPPAIDLLDRLVCFFVLLSLLVTAFSFTSWGALFYGAKYDLLPLALLGVAKLVPWSDAFRRNLMKTLVVLGAVVAVLGILSLAVPQAVLTALGYSDLHSLYVPNGPLAPFQLLGGSSLRRVQSVMSGPNQLGIWLLLPLAAAWTRLAHAKKGQVDYGALLSLVLILSCLGVTFSRSAWVGALVVLGAGAWWFFPKKLAKRLIGSLVLAAAVLALLLLALSPAALERISSSRGHLIKPLEALATMGAHPFGMGLGTAGPASNRLSDVCVELRPEDDASWAKSHPELCVFLGDTQVQPENRVCSCPVLPENWYLQVGIETGVLGLLLFLGILNAAWVELRKRREVPGAAAASLALLGTMAAALFLHAWEDAAVAYTLWLMIGVVLAHKPAATS